MFFTNWTHGSLSSIHLLYLVSYNPLYWSCNLYPLSCILYHVSFIKNRSSCVLCSVTLYIILYLVSCIVYQESFILYPVFCILCPVSCVPHHVSWILCSVSCILYPGQININWRSDIRFLYSVYYILCSVSCTLYPGQITINWRSDIRYPISCILFIISSVLYPVPYIQDR